MVRINGKLYVVRTRRQCVRLGISGLVMVLFLAVFAVLPGFPSEVAGCIMAAMLGYGYFFVAIGHYPALRRVHPETQAAMDAYEARYGVLVENGGNGSV